MDKFTKRNHEGGFGHVHIGQDGDRKGLGCEMTGKGFKIDKFFKRSHEGDLTMCISVTMVTGKALVTI